MILVAARVPVILAVLTILVRIGATVVPGIAMRAVVARRSRDRRGRTVAVAGIGERS
jgi:hypothetical protein